MRLYVSGTREWRGGTLRVTDDMPDPADGGLATRAEVGLNVELGVESRWL